jgi:hypothetical protein
MVNVMILTNTQAYEQDISAFLGQSASLGETVTITARNVCSFFAKLLWRRPRGYGFAITKFDDG